MEDNVPYQHYVQAQTPSKIIKKRKQCTQQFQKIEYFDLIPPIEEPKFSRSDSEADYKQIFLVKAKNKVIKETGKDKDHDIVKDLIINKQVPLLETDDQSTWEFEEAEQFFRKKDQWKENIPDDYFKY
jgi:hypothetical protein